MGLLGRRHTTYQLPNAKRNSTNENPSQSSLIAAQAAAQLFQNNHNNTNNINTSNNINGTSNAAANAASIPHPPPSASAEKRPNGGLRRAVSVSGTPSAKSKPIVVKKSPAPVKTNDNHNTTNINHNQNANIEKLSLSDQNEENKKLDENTQQPQPLKLTKVRSRSPAPPLPKASQQSQTSQVSGTTMQAIANAAAKSAATSAANSSADLLAPPNQYSKVYPSSPQISLGSSNSIDSAPFSLKPAINMNNGNNNSNNNNNNNNNNNHNNRSSIEVPAIQPKDFGNQSHPNYPNYQQPTPRFYFDPDRNGSDYSTDRSSLRSSSAGSEYMTTPKSQRASGGSATHLALDTIPSRIDEHESEYQYESEPNDYDFHNSYRNNTDDQEFNDYDEYYSDVPESQIDRPLDPLSRVSTTNTINTFNSKKPIRKPPPTDFSNALPHPPSMSSRQPSGASVSPTSQLQQNSKPPLQRRSTSPRRKPPPGSTIPYMNHYDTDSFLDYEDPANTLYDAEEEQDDEPLPQYPLSIEDQEARKKHRHHHGFRKNAKNMLKRGFRSATSSNPSSYLVHDEDSKPVQLKTTMRTEKKKSIFNEDKPWKHHNDREYITEQERKRYDGVWMANKGLYMDLIKSSTTIEKPKAKPGSTQIQDHEDAALKASMLSTGNEPPPPETNLMLNFVVKDLWSRSQLPPDLLRQIWDLVDTRGDGCLERKSFIIGMWLVDQCLYGRKLPKQLDAAVWNSLSQLGVNVVIKPKKRSR